MAFGKNCTLTQFPDSTLTFFVQIVPFSGLFMDDFSRPGDFESLLRPAVCFHFRHIIFKIKLLSRNAGRKPFNP
jgi:hypothetical protein